MSRCGGGSQKRGSVALPTQLLALCCTRSRQHFWQSGLQAKGLTYAAEVRSRAQPAECWHQALLPLCCVRRCTVCRQTPLGAPWQRLLRVLTIPRTCSRLPAPRAACTWCTSTPVCAPRPQHTASCQPLPAPAATSCRRCYRPLHRCVRRRLVVASRIGGGRFEDSVVWLRHAGQGDGAVLLLVACSCHCCCAAVSRQRAGAGHILRKRKDRAVCSPLPTHLQRRWFAGVVAYDVAYDVVADANCCFSCCPRYPT